MRRMFAARAPGIRIRQPPRLILLAAGVTLLITGPAQAAPAAHPAARTARTALPGILAPTAAGPSAAQAAAAAATCARFATAAGWANSGYYGGGLVTAIAVCMAESAGDARLISCLPNGHGDYPGFHCPAGTTSEDRGLWQFNSKAQHAPSDACAFDPVCDADAAYLDWQYGTSFYPWSSYDQDLYAHQIDAAQAAVSALRGGTVAGAYLGECLARAGKARGAAVVLGNCGTSFASQQWSAGAGVLRSGLMCATVTAGGGVVMDRCDGSAAQAWHVYGQDELRDAKAGRCLTDPGGSLVKGTKVTLTRCANRKDQTWWLP